MMIMTTPALCLQDRETLRTRVATITGLPQSAVPYAADWLMSNMRAVTTPGIVEITGWGLRCLIELSETWVYTIDAVYTHFPDPDREGTKARYDRARATIQAWQLMYCTIRSCTMGGRNLNVHVEADGHLIDVRINDGFAYLGDLRHNTAAYAAGVEEARHVARTLYTVYSGHSLGIERRVDTLVPLSPFFPLSPLRIILFGRPDPVQLYMDRITVS